MHDCVDLLLHSLLGINFCCVDLIQHKPVLVAVLRHLFAFLINRLQLWVAAQQLGDTFVPAQSRKNKVNLNRGNKSVNKVKLFLALRKLICIYERNCFPIQDFL